MQDRLFDSMTTGNQLKIFSKRKCTNERSDTINKIWLFFFTFCVFTVSDLLSRFCIVCREINVLSDIVEKSKKVCISCFVSCTRRKISDFVDATVFIYIRIEASFDSIQFVCFCMKRHNGITTCCIFSNTLNVSQHF